MKVLTARLVQFVLTVLFVVFATSVMAQTSKPLPTPLKWKSNNLLLISEWSDKGPVYYEYNVKNGKKEHVEKPVEVDNSPYVSVKDGDIWYYAPDGVEKQLTNTKETEMNPTLSPDMQRVAFTRSNDLYSIELSTGKEIRYTDDGTNLILNGWASWVYYEEIFGRASRYKAFWWSPDSKRLAFYRFDDTKVPLFPIYYSTGQHGYLHETRYPKAGDPNPEVKIGFVAANGGAITWADFNPSEDQYLGTPYWNSTSTELFVQWLNRDQNNLIMYAVDCADGSKRAIYNETQNTWIDWIDDIQFGKDGFYFVRDFELWEQIYYQPYNGGKLVKMTDGNNWGIKVVDFDEQNGEIFYLSRKEISTRFDFYRVRWNKRRMNDSKTGVAYGKIERLSTGNYNYAFPLLSPDKKRFVSIVSNVSTPHRIVMVKDGKIDLLFDSGNGQLASAGYPKREMRFLTTDDGYRLPGVITFPENFDSTKKYPVIVDIYGGPNSGIVMDSWRNIVSTTAYWAKEGVIQISVDNRSSGHCGKAGMNCIHRMLGKYEIQDFMAWGKYLVSLPYVNADKIGITGFSFGGTMTVMALTEGSKYFKYGIAGGGVYDWRLYDSHYTERYMDSPQDNPDGYAVTAAINHVKQYRADMKEDDKTSLLLLTHGTGDDNVHLQNTMQLVDALQKSGRHFELMLYPGGMHGYRGYQARFSDGEDRLFWKKTLLQ